MKFRIKFASANLAALNRTGISHRAFLSMPAKKAILSPSFNLPRWSDP